MPAVANIMKEKTQKAHKAILDAWDSSSDQQNESLGTQNLDNRAVDFLKVS